MQPQDANLYGNVHGGNVMKLMDEAGASAAIRHARQPVVTVAVDQVLFREPIHLGDLLTVTAELTYVGRTSMEVRIEVQAENLVSRQVKHTNTAFFVYVALNADGQPTPVPPLRLDTDEERRQWAEAEKRQAYRLAQRKIAKEG
jgi:acyl-CoA hydrolase